jgi:ATP-dependent helicase HrpB
MLPEPNTPSPDRPLSPGKRSDLPIEDLRDAIISSLREGNRLIVEAPTGSGKSTQIPQMLLDAGLLGSGRAVILQPRRLAARMLAARVAQERGGRIGGEVGYRIRLDDASGPDTRLLFVTEGILVRQMLGDPDLRGVSALLFDEFHERHLYSDISLAQALALQATRRPDLKIVVMSATLDTSTLTEYLQPVTVLRSSGRTHPVNISYLTRDPGDEKPWDLAAEAAVDMVHRTEGNLLIFMPGAYEIARTISTLRVRLPAGIVVMPLHGELTPADQDAAVSPGGSRKVIVSTNVAETSLTIDGITGVIDSGQARIASFDPRRGINTLLIAKISRASADQRAGRAGRTAPGICLRLWTEREHTRRIPREAPEIHRVDLSEVLLTLKAAGFTSMESIRWLDAPQPAAILKAETLLRDLGAVDHAGEITPLGRRMLAFPTHPRYARMLLAAQEFGCVRAVALMAALTQSRPLLLRTDRKTEEERQDLFGGGGSDFLVMARAFRWAEKNDFRADRCRQLAVHGEAAKQTGRVFQQFLSLAEAQGLDVDAPAAPDENLARCILAGFADQVARRKGSGTNLCDIVHGRRGLLSKESAAAESRLLVAAEISEIGQGSGEVRVQLSMATAIDEQMLRDLFPGDFTDRNDHIFDTSVNRVVRRTEKMFRDLVLESIHRDAQPCEEAAKVLAAHLAEGDLPLPTWKEEAEEWMQRVQWLAHHHPELGLPSFDEAERHTAMEHWCEGAVGYREVKDRPALPALQMLLSPAQRSALDRLAPERHELPAGRKARLLYKATGQVTMSASIQDLFGVTAAPRLAGGKAEVTIEILAPNRRPIQITRDLESFWKETYPGIRPELSRRYPKHLWK